MGKEDGSVLEAPDYEGGGGGGTDLANLVRRVIDFGVYPRLRLDLTAGSPWQGTADGEIRVALRDFISSCYSEQDDALILEELAIWGGETRADLAVCNGCLHGFEIKSDADTLKRLPKQVEAYNAIFDRATLVTTQRHLERAQCLIPEWWGLVTATFGAQGIELVVIRGEGINPDPQGVAIASLLWRAELLAILVARGLDLGIRTKPVATLIERLANHLSANEISEHARRAIRVRGDWTAAARRKQCGEKSRRRATASRYQYVFHSRIPQ